MKKTIRITESELKEIIKRVISEASPLAAPGAAPAPVAPPTLSATRPDINFPDIPEKKTPSPPPPKTIFGIGDRDPKILAFQKNLVALGYNVGKKGADGIFGPATEAAVRDFQGKNGIKVSGRVGPPTMRKLVEVVKAKKEVKPEDPNAEWNEDRAYSELPKPPAEPTKTTTQPKTPTPRPARAGGSGILSNKLRNIEPRGFQPTTKTPLKNFNDWVAKNRLY